MEPARHSPTLPRSAWHRNPLAAMVVVLALLSIVVARPVHAQWETQSFDLKAGWNAIYLHVDPAHTNINGLISRAPIEEIWLWAAQTSVRQFVTSPQAPHAGSQWISWSSGAPDTSDLKIMAGNQAYLVKLNNATPTYRWSIVGKPVPPRYDWTSSGLNLVGFPTIAGSAPMFESFLEQSPELLQAAQIFQYVGGDLGLNNPQEMFGLRTTPVKRGEAFWVRAPGLNNRYFGPLEFDLQDAAGVRFGDRLSQYRVRVRNLAKTDLTLTLNLLPSETPPAGQTAIVQTPPVIIRGDLNPTQLTYGYSALNTTKTWSLKRAGTPGSEIEIVLGLNRGSMTGNPGDLFAGILKFTDSLNLTDVHVPVSAQAGSLDGLWVGAALVHQVQHYLKSFSKDPDGKPTLGPAGNYVATGTNTSLGGVAKPMELRLIVHNDSTNGRLALMQRAYLGTRDSNSVVATLEALLDRNNLAVARRVSAPHLPWSPSNTVWTMTGSLAQGQAASTDVIVGHDNGVANPFVHTYHPDHDTLDPLFAAPVAQGVESYGIRRRITLQTLPPPDDFASLTTGGRQLNGTYRETITLNGKGTESRSFDVVGAFSLNLVSTVPTLTQP